MKLANILKITNNSPYNTVLCPKDKTLANYIAIFCGGNSSKVLDLIMDRIILNLDEFYFQFIHDKKKISIKNIHKYGVKLEYQFYEPKLSSYHNISIIPTPAYPTKNDVYSNK